VPSILSILQSHLLDVYQIGQVTTIGKKMIFINQKPRIIL
jgi:hypothetical protein